jgi:hypothetical protein
MEIEFFLYEFITVYLILYQISESNLKMFFDFELKFNVLKKSSLKLSKKFF